MKWHAPLGVESSRVSQHSPSAIEPGLRLCGSDCCIASKSKAEPKQQTMAGPDRKDSPKPPQERMLSAVSKQYDFDGDGKLDEAEQAL